MDKWIQKNIIFPKILSQIQHKKSKQQKYKNIQNQINETFKNKDTYSLYNIKPKKIPNSPYKYQEEKRSYRKIIPEQNQQSYRRFSQNFSSMKKQTSEQKIKQPLIQQNKKYFPFSDAIFKQIIQKRFKKAKKAIKIKTQNITNQDDKQIQKICKPNFKNSFLDIKQAKKHNYCIIQKRNSLNNKTNENEIKNIKMYFKKKHNQFKITDISGWKHEQNQTKNIFY